MPRVCIQLHQKGGIGPKDGNLRRRFERTSQKSWDKATAPRLGQTRHIGGSSSSYPAFSVSGPILDTHNVKIMIGKGATNV